jgi:predicted transposase YdaD
MSDSLFRGAFSNPLVARQFLSAWLPKVFVDLVDWSSLEVRKIAGINEALAERREDVVYRLKAAGREVHFYILVEHQVAIPRRMALRMLEYVLLIWRQWRSEAETEGIETDLAGAGLPLVVPIVLHPGPKAWGKLWRLRELIDVPDDLRHWADTFAPDGGFCLVELAGVPWEKLAEGHLARAILAALQAERQGPMGFEEVRRIVGELFEEEHRDVATDLAALLWTFLLQASDLRGEEVRRIVEETIPPEEKEQFMSTAEMLKEEGRAEGRQEGRVEGRLEGRVEGRLEGHLSALRDAIFDLLEIRFTEIPAEVRESVLQVTDLTHLRQLVRRAGVCASLEDFAAER